MKDTKFYAGIVIGFSMSFVLLSTGLAFAPAYAPPTIGTNDIVDDAIISQNIKDGEEHLVVYVPFEHDKN